MNDGFVNSITRSKTFIQAMEEVVACGPDRPAIVLDGEVVCTYQTLWDTAGDIALELLRRGCSRNQLVAIEISKSPSAIAAILGVWRAGAAWVPIPPELPDAIRSFMLTDSAARFSIVDTHLRPNIDPPADSSQVIDIRQWMNSHCGLRIADAHSRFSAAPPTAEPCDPEDLAYVIYTSGTTGRPRGVAVRHRGLVPMLLQQISMIGLTETSRSLFLLSLTFDAAISDIGTALLSGAALCLESSVSEGGRLTATPENLLALISQRQVTYVDLPPSLLARMPVEQCPNSLQCILIGGEVCPADVVRRWAERVRLISVYGPTEATICTSMVVCDQNWDEPRIGTPLDGTTYRIMNDEPEGELLIGGIGLAAEYVGQPALTTDRFPIIDGVRYYRTGDCVRIQNGDYIFLGRLDRQVKIRGHRIEPEQIESVLQTHSGVLRCAVLCESDDAGCRSLAAFVTTDPGYIWRPSPESELRTLVAQTLPWWMIPASFQVLESMPITSTGKIDFQRLKVSQSTVTFGERPLDQDLSATARSVLTAMRHVLQRTDLSADEHFLDAGGDSLRVVELIALLQSQNILLPPSGVYRFGSARLIANHVEPILQSCSTTVDCLSADWLRADVEPLARKPLQLNLSTTQNSVSQNTTILLTGATGFLGMHVLKELLLLTDARIVCLLRGSKRTASLDRLFTSLNATGIALTESHRQRIEVCHADLSQESFGLPAEKFTQLAQEVSHIVHCAADISAIADYQSVRAVNVVGTASIIRLAILGRPKRLMVASTLSVFVNTDHHAGYLSESDDLTSTKSVYGGYAQSKWAAEWLLRRCQTRLPGLQIIRLGLLIPDAGSAPSSRNDLLSMTLRALTRLGCVPECRPEVRMDSTPVSFAATGMVHLLMQQSRDQMTFHFAHPAGIKATLLFQTLMTFRPELQRLNAAEFSDRIRERLSQQGERHDLEAMACMALSRRVTLEAAHDPPGPLDLFLATDCDFDSRNTVQHLLSQSNTKMPEPEQLAVSLVQRILSDADQHASTAADRPSVAAKETAP